jgi:hypothetical protein
MRSAIITLALAGIVLLGLIGAVHAAGPAVSPGSPFTPQTFGCGGPVAGCDSALLRQWEFYRDMPMQLMDRDHRAKEWDKEYARKQSQKLIDALSVPCELADAEYAGGGEITANGKLLDIKVYEVACRSGTGYFLVSQPPQNTLAVSCFTAEAARESDIAKGLKHDEFTCGLGRFSDVKAMAASVVKGAGAACDVSDYHWVGVSTTNGTEYSEVACANGKGYVVEIPKAGTPAEVSVVDCQEAVKQGVKCKLTAVTMPVTLQTFRDALKEHGADCADAEMRYIGRESQGRRYVVELQCPQKPNGLVAFIPLEDNPKPFETLDCPTAAARSAVKCTLTGKQ